MKNGTKICMIFINDVFVMFVNRENNFIIDQKCQKNRQKDINRNKCFYMIPPIILNYIYFRDNFDVGIKLS